VNTPSLESMEIKSPKCVLLISVLLPPSGDQKN
jgi:hypothetical protein